MHLNIQKTSLLNAHQKVAQISLTETEVINTLLRGLERLVGQIFRAGNPQGTC